MRIGVCSPVIGTAAAMWRIPGLVCRALNRFHVANVQGCVHGEAEALNPSSLIPLGQNAGSKSHSSQSSGEHGGQNGQGQKKKGSFQFCAGQLPQYTVLDAFGVGAVAVLFLHLARQISSHCSSSSSREERAPRCIRLQQILASLSQCNNLYPQTSAPLPAWTSCQQLLRSAEYRQDLSRPCAALESIPSSSGIPSSRLQASMMSQACHMTCHVTRASGLASEKQQLPGNSSEPASAVKSHIVPKVVQPCTWNDLHLRNEANLQDADASFENSSPAPSSGVLHHVSDHGESLTEGFLHIRSSYGPGTREASTSKSAQELLGPKEEIGESLQVAASRLLDITETSVPTVLNIFGIVSARDSGDYRTAFRFFQESAEAGYSKAQYNTAVCYEKGQGVGKDTAKAAELYLLAARGGHQQAKYRYARILLSAKAENTKLAVEMLQEAAEAGVKEAQAYLGVFYSKESHLDSQKAARYFWMAAENGDVQSRYHLGVCYDQGFGVPASRQEALRHFERAAKSGHVASRQKLVELQSHVTEGIGSPLASLRTTTSSPCLPVLEQMNIRMEPKSNFTANSPSGLGLLHSLSTGDLIRSSANSGSYLLAPIHMTGLAPPMASLRAIGVG